MKINVATKDTNDPKLDTKFHPAYESGKSGILLGINCVIPILKLDSWPYGIFLLKKLL